jgi:endonuclease/exonuclease/phosphatase family metal-dependent hydrolase
MNSGGAILSRYPLKNHQIQILDKPASNPWWYNLFYLHRYLQQVNVDVGEKSFHLVNLHLEAFDKANRENQIQELIGLHKKEEIDFIAGDFNMVPDAATQKSKFINGDDYTGDLSFRLMGESGLDEVIPMDIYEKSEKDYFTFPSSKPDRRLDYIFYQRGLKLMKAEVLSSALSDHLPLSAIFQINSPKVNPYSL